MFTLNVYRGNGPKVKRDYPLTLPIRLLCGSPAAIYGDCSPICGKDLRAHRPRSRAHPFITKMRGSLLSWRHCSRPSDAGKKRGHGMTSELGNRGAQTAILGSEHAPFIYFDSVATLAVHHGAVQIELVANVLVPLLTAGNVAKTDYVVTAHLRCSPKAADDLRRSLDKILNALKTPGESAGQSLSVDNSRLS